MVPKSLPRLAALLLVLLVVAAAPWRSASAAPPLSLYGNLPGFELATLSPSGERIAMVGVAAEERRLIVLDRNGKPLLAAPLGDAKIRSIHFAGEDLVLVRKSDTVDLAFGFTAAKAELSTMVVVPLGGGKAWHVFGSNKMIQGGIRGFHGLSERDGKWYGYFGGITLEGSAATGGGYLSSTAPVLYEVDLQTRRARKIASRADPDGYRDWVVGPDGQVSATLDFNSRSGAWTIRNGAGARIASGTDPLGGVELIGFGTSATTILYGRPDGEDGKQRWYEVPVAGGDPVELLPDVAVASSFFDSRTRQFAGYEIDGDTPSYHFFNPYQHKVITATLKAFPKLSVSLIDWNDRFDRLIVRTEGVGDPVTWWLVDIKTGKADPLGTSYPMKDQDVAPMRMYHYKAADGLDIAAVLTLPPGRPAKNLPVIIFPHGGPHARDYPVFNWWAQALASRGYAVLQPNFRGSTGYGASFERAGYGEWGRKMQSDISDGLAQLARDGIVDPTRACIMGASYGGYAALAGVTLQQGLYRCAVSVAGVSDVAKMVATDRYESGGNRTVSRQLREYVGTDRDLRAVSPINFADKADAPVLLIHGKDDIVVLYDQSNDMAAALRRAGKPVAFVTLPGEDHWLSRGTTRLAMLEAAAAFIERHNPPDTPVHSSKTAE